ncbi:MAG: hypothetical protein ACKVOJ_01280 [Sphingomonadaceae bacterium]
MRFTLILLATTALSACSGAGPTTVGSSAVSASATGGTPAVPASGHTFVNPTEVRTYNAIGGAHSFQYSTDNRNPGASSQYGQLYRGDASTARNSGITVNYNPRDAIYSFTLSAPLGGVDQTYRFQDPLHRTAFGGLSEPQSGVPNISGKGIQYLQSGSANGQLQFDPAESTTFPVGAASSSLDQSTFFYQQPGTTTKYVTYAGYVRNAVSIVPVTITPATTTTPATTYLQYDYTLQRAAFAFGERTLNSAVPKTGTGTFNGDLIATLIYNPLPDTTANAPTYFQWLDGTSRTIVNFAANTFTIDLAGTVRAPDFDLYTTRQFTLQSGATFSAAGSGRIDLVGAGGFLGSINRAGFTQPNGTQLGLNIAGSSVDGAFFGPAAQEVGGGFRIVGGVPDERIDILGAFIGKQ